MPSESVWMFRFYQLYLGLVIFANKAQELFPNHKLPAQLSFHLHPKDFRILCAGVLIEVVDQVAFMISSWAQK